jgi:hypothetical protein
MKYLILSLSLSLSLSGCAAFGGVMPWIQANAPAIAASTVGASAISAYEGVAINTITLEEKINK